MICTCKGMKYELAFPTLSTNPVDKSTRTSVSTSATRTTARKPDVTRKPIGITVPYRDPNSKTMTHLELLEEKVKALEKRIEKLEKEKK